MATLKTGWAAGDGWHEYQVSGVSEARIEVLVENDLPVRVSVTALDDGEAREINRSLARDLADSFGLNGVELGEWSAKGDGEVVATVHCVTDGLDVGDYVETIGLSDEDSDAGRVVAINGSRLEVAWDSGVRTTIDASTVRVVPRGYRSRHGRDNGLSVYE